MNVLAALGDAPTAAIAVIAILLGIFVVVRGRRGEHGGDEKAAPSLLAVPVAGPGTGGADADDGLQKMAVHDIGHGTIRLGGVASPNTKPAPVAARLPPQLPPVAVAPEPEPEPQAAAAEPEPVVPEPEPATPEPEPEPVLPEQEPEPVLPEPEPEPEPAPAAPEPQPPTPQGRFSPGRIRLRKKPSRE